MSFGCQLLQPAAAATVTPSAATRAIDATTNVLAAEAGTNGLDLVLQLLAVAALLVIGSLAVAFVARLLNGRRPASTPCSGKP